MNTKNIPNNLEAEQSVLGSMIISKYALQKASDVLTKESFYSEANGDLFIVLCEMLNKKIPVFDFYACNTSEISVLYTIRTLTGRLTLLKE